MHGVGHSRSRSLLSCFPFFFTLTHPVANANDLEVFVGNVRQEPTAAYSAAGTTLTMAEAPDTGLNFYVLNKSQAQVTTTLGANSVAISFQEPLDKFRTRVDEIAVSSAPATTSICRYNEKYHD